MITLTDLHKSFGATRVLAGLNLKVATGESLVVIGGSGTGKSVMLKCILGLVTPDRGSIMLDGEDVTKVPHDDFLAKFGMLFQGGALFDSLPVWQNVAFRVMRGTGRMDVRAARALAVETLARVGLGPDVADLFPAELSGGMQKRVGLARAIVGNPAVMFFDEPTAGLDPTMAAVINALIRRIVTETGATAVTITHDLRTLHEVADRVAMLHQGVFHWQGQVGEVMGSPDPVLRQFTRGEADVSIAPRR